MCKAEGNGFAFLLKIFILQKISIKRDIFQFNLKSISH